MTTPLDRRTLDLPDEAASLALGASLAAVVREGFRAGAEPDGFTVHLSGDLGAGKTTLVRAALRALGVEGRIKSPTYTLVEPYVVEIATSDVESRHRMKLDCYHFDFYRFEDPREWLDAGFREYFSDVALRLVEWPEKVATGAGSLLPAPDWRIALDLHGEGRRAGIEAHTPRGVAWLSRVAPPPAAAS